MNTGPRDAVGGRVDHLTVRVDNRTGLAVQVDALDASGDRVGLGEAEAKALTTTRSPISARAGHLSPPTETARSTGRR